MPSAQPLPSSFAAYFKSATSRALRTFDVIRMFDGSFHIVQYVNHAGAYVVPLLGVNQEIKGKTITFSAGGKTISATSIVEVVHPLVMGGSSIEYRRYVKMVSASEGKEGTVMDDSKGVSLGNFDSADTAPVPGSEFDADAGTVSAESLTAPKGKGKDKDMAKRAKAAKSNGNGKARAAKATKTVRSCVCGCGTETTGYFAPGHDARYHGWIKKLADGRIQRNGKDAKTGEQVVGAAVLNKMGLVASGEGFKAKTPEFYAEG